MFIKMSKRIPNFLLTLLKNRYLLLLLIIQMIVNHRWFATDIFINSDYHYFFRSFFLDNLHPNIWQGASNLGSISLTPWRIPQDYLFGLLSQIGMSMNQADKILLIWPTLFTTVIAGYIFSLTLTKDKKASFFSTLVYISSTYFLAINSQGHFLLTLSTNFGVISLAVFILATERNKTQLFVFSAILLVFSSIADLRPTLIALALISIYMLLGVRSFILDKRSALHYLGNFLLMPIIFMSSSAFYIIPLIYAKGADDILVRPLFGSNFWRFLPAFAGFHPFWSATNLEWFRVNTVQVYFFIIPITSILAALLVKVSVKKIFLLTVLVIGIFLSKQVSEPFGFIYGFLFSNLPGFGAFRESTKFYPIVTVGYTGLISLWMSYRSPNYYLSLSKKISALCIVAYFILNLYPIFSGTIGNLYIPSKLHQDYITLNNAVEKDEDSYRLLWVPLNDRHHPESAKKPSIDVGYLIQSLPNDIDLSPSEKLISQKMVIGALFNQASIQEILSAYSIKYIVVPKNEDGDDAFAAFGKDRDYFVRLLRNVTGLEEINSGYEKINVFRNNSFEQRVSIRSIEGKYIPSSLVISDSGTYEVSYSSHSIEPNTYYLIEFREHYNPGWILQLPGEKTLGNMYPSKYILQDIQAKHFETSYHLNRYVVQGSIMQKNSVFRIVFEKQRYLIIGFYISLVSLCIIFVYFTILFTKRIRSSRY